MITFTQLMEKRVGRQTMAPTPDDPLKQAVRAPGDVGKVERLQQMDKNKSKMTRVPDTAQRMAAAKDNPELAAKADEVLTDLGVDTSRVGSVRTPRNYRNPEQFARRIAQIGRKMNNVQSDQGMVDDPAETEIDPKYDADAAAPTVEKPGPPPRGWSLDSRSPEHKEYTAKLKAYQAAQENPNTYAGGNPDTIERMASADLAGRDRITAADQDFDDAIVSAQGPTLRDPIVVDTPDGPKKFYDSPELEHGYQPSGVGVMNKKEFDTEYMDALIGGILDPDQASSDKVDAILGVRDDISQKSKPAVIRTSKGGDIDTEVKDPTRRDVEAMSDQGELRGELEGRAYLTPEVREKQQAMRDALVGQQSDKVQELAFKFKDVSDEQVDEFIDRFGQARGRVGKEGKKRIIAEIEARGGVDGERSVIWGGDIKVPAAARKDNDGNPLPKGQVNMAKIDDEDLKAEIRAQRARELVRTYLKQGGINAYAQHEGFRSMLDMDLEHIKSLKAGGYDSPDNWVWASSNLNQLRGDKDLGPFVDTRVTDSGITGPEGGAKLGGTTQNISRADAVKTFNSFIRQNPDNQEKLDNFKADIGDPSAFQVTNRGIFAPDEYAKLDQDEIEQLRAAATKHYGFTDDMAASIFPDKGRLSGNPLGDIEMGDTEDYEQYDQDSTTNRRDQVIYRNMKNDKNLFKNIPSAQRKALILQQFKSLPASAARDDVPPYSPPQEEEDLTMEF